VEKSNTASASLSCDHVTSHSENINKTILSCYQVAILSCYQVASHSENTNKTILQQHFQYCPAIKQQAIHKIQTPEYFTTAFERLSC
jgi:hypothetical protein